MVYLILRLIFFYILFLFVKSLFKSFMVKKIRKGFESMQGDFYSQQNPGQYQRKKNDDDAIEAEYRKL